MNIKMTRGDSKAIAGKVTTVPAGAAVDITSHLIWFTAKRRISDADNEAVFQKTVGDGITVTDGPAGEFAIQINPSDTSGLSDVEANNLYYDLQVKTGSTVQTLSKGRLLVEYDVTKTS